MTFSEDIMSCGVINVNENEASIMENRLNSFIDCTQQTIDQYLEFNDQFVIKLIKLKNIGESIQSDLKKNSIISPSRKSRVLLDNMLNSFPITETSEIKSPESNKGFIDKVNSDQIDDKIGQDFLNSETLSSELICNEHEHVINEPLQIDLDRLSDRSSVHQNERSEFKLKPCKVVLHRLKLNSDKKSLIISKDEDPIQIEPKNSIAEALLSEPDNLPMEPIDNTQISFNEPTLPTPDKLPIEPVDNTQISIDETTSFEPENSPIEPVDKAQISFNEPTLPTPDKLPIEPVDNTQISIDETTSFEPANSPIEPVDKAQISINEPTLPEPENSQVVPIDQIEPQFFTSTSETIPTIESTQSSNNELNEESPIKQCQIVRDKLNQILNEQHQLLKYKKQLLITEIEPIIDEEEIDELCRPIEFGTEFEKEDSGSDEEEDEDEDHDRLSKNLDDEQKSTHVENAFDQKSLTPCKIILERLNEHDFLHLVKRDDRLSTDKRIEDGINEPMDLCNKTNGFNLDHKLNDTKFENSIDEEKDSQISYNVSSLALHIDKDTGDENESFTQSNRAKVSPYFETLII